MKESLKRLTAGAALAAGSILAPHMDNPASAQENPNQETDVTTAPGGNVVPPPSPETNVTTEPGGNVIPPPSPEKPDELPVTGSNNTTLGMIGGATLAAGVVASAASKNQARKAQNN